MITFLARFLDGSVWEAEPENQYTVRRRKSEAECKEIKRRKAVKLSVKSSPVRRSSSAAGHQTSSIGLLLAMFALTGLRC